MVDTCIGAFPEEPQGGLFEGSTNCNHGPGPGSMMTEQGTLERFGDTYRSGNEASRSGNEASRSGNEAIVKLIIIAQSMINTSSGTYPTHSRVTVVTLEHPDNDRIGRITSSILVHLCKVFKSTHNNIISIPTTSCT